MEDGKLWKWLLKDCFDKSVDFIYSYPYRWSSVHGMSTWHYICIEISTEGGKSSGLCGYSAVFEISAICVSLWYTCVCWGMGITENMTFSTQMKVSLLMQQKIMLIRQRRVHWVCPYLTSETSLKHLSRPSMIICFQKQGSIRWPGPALIMLHMIGFMSTTLLYQKNHYDAFVLWKN